MFRVYIRDRTRITAWSLSWSNIIVTGNSHLNLQFLLSLRCENQVFCFDKLRRAKEGNAKEKKRHLHALIGGPGANTASSQTTGPHVWRAMVAVFFSVEMVWFGPHLWSRAGKVLENSTLCCLVPSVADLHLVTCYIWCKAWMPELDLHNWTIGRTSIPCVDS